MNPTTDCPEASTLDRLLHGLIPGPEGEELTRHLETCPSCAPRSAASGGPDRLTTLLRAGAGRTTDPDLPAILDRIRHRTGGATAGGDETGADESLPVAPPEGPGEWGRLGPYRVLGLLGTGGIGLVYRAEDDRLGRAVALKVLRPRFARRATARDRFLREARAAAAVQDDRVVTIYEVGEAGGTPFLAMELLDGETLDDRLRREGRLPMLEVLRIGREVAFGLAAAHDKGLIHRDVKPSNVWLEAPSGRVKLLDFGLAKPADEAHLTLPGELAGTPAYMSPEQAREAPLDGQTDLFSLGVVLYQLASGRLPFPGETAWATLTSLATEAPPRLRSLNPDVPPALAALVARLLDKDRTRRPPSAAAVAAELRAIGDGTARRPRIARWAAALAAIAILCIGAVILRIKHQDGSETRLEVPDGQKAEYVPRPGDVITVENGPIRETPPAIRADGFEQVWADDFERSLSRWTLMPTTAGLPSNIDATNPAAGKGLLLNPTAKVAASAYRPLGVKPPFYLAARVRHAATTPVNAYKWRFQLNLKAAPDPRSADRFLADESFVAPGPWADVMIRYEVVGGMVEATTWVNGQPVAHRREATTPNEIALGFVELVAGNGDAWFDDFRVLTDLPDPADRKAVADWSEAMRADDGAKAKRALFGLAADLEKRAGVKPRVLAAAARQRAERMVPVLTASFAPVAHTRAARTLAFTPDGSGIVSGGLDGMIRVWLAATGEKLAVWLSGVRNVGTLLVLPNGTILSGGDGETAIRAWNEKGKKLYQLDGHTDSVGHLAATDDGKTLFSGGKDGTVRRWDVAGRKELEPVDRFEGRWSTVACSADGKVVLTSVERLAVRLGGKGLEPPAREAVAVSADGKRAFTIGADNSLQVRDGATGKVLATAASAGDRFACGAVSHDVSRLAVGRDDGGIEIRDAATGRPLARLAGHNARVWQVAFAPDGKTLASVSADSTLRFWDLTNMAKP